MTYQVLARKWRPPKFSDLVGQTLVTRTLENAIRSDRVAHAFLFSGVRGVGKTTTARILAKALNCHRGLSPEPCGECVSCLEISTSSSVDVLEIDAASNTGVDNIREIRESVRYGTARDRFKIFIIDEVHMLSTAAFNALLKTLEEPPAHVKFILATTELNKIPVTITSRCQQFDFKPIPFAMLVDRLRHICREEEVEISEYGLRAVAAAARGSMRDAESALDQIMSLAGRKVTDEDVRALLGVVDEKVLIALVESVQKRDRTSLLDQMRELGESGVDPHAFCRKFIAHVRNLMVCRVSGWNEQLLHLPDSDKDALMEQSSLFTELDLIRFYDLLSRTEEELRSHPYPLIHLEMALMKMVELARLPTLEEVVSKLGAPGAVERIGTAPAGRLPTGAGGPGSSREEIPTASRGAKSPKLDLPPPVPPSVPPDPVPDAAAAQTGLSGPDVVDYLRKSLQKDHIRISSSMDHASRLAFEDGRLEIQYSAKEAFHHSILDAPDARKVVSEACARITGSEPRVDVTLVGGTAPRDEAVDPMDDPRFKTFYEAFPGKYVVRKSED